MSNHDSYDPLELLSALARLTITSSPSHEIPNGGGNEIGLGSNQGTHSDNAGLHKHDHAPLTLG